MQSQLRELWNSLNSTVNTHPEDESTKARYIENNVWLVVDDVDGFHLCTDSEIASIFLGIDLVP